METELISDFLGLMVKHDIIHEDIKKVLEKKLWKIDRDRKIFSEYRLLTEGKEKITGEEARFKLADKWCTSEKNIQIILHKEKLNAYKKGEKQ